MAYATLRALMEAERRVTVRGATAWLVAGLAERLGRERMLFNARAAIERYQGDDDGKEKQGE